MKPRHLLLATLATLMLPAATLSTPPLYLAAVSDPGRPAADKARDADRKPADMLAFAKVRPGQTVVDYIPSKGYFTRLFSAAVGPKGKVYAVTPQLMLDLFAKGGHPAPPSVTTEPGRGNVQDAVAKDGSLGVPDATVDLVWTAQNYHDIHIFAGADGAAQLNKAAFAALKPGGLYVVLDHAAQPGLDDAGMKTLHRIDEALVKKEVLAAGFVADGESDALRNPADPHSANVFDPSIRGKTDQFILRFRKPK
ncbi:class I SAM-dependent methyltransferase [Sphingomonas abietis]|uniref:Methyltransferase n=1 Tax=Sphingomonas abietis TaxID=3012344 RepID=A0ABY7NIW3_9SPHN|nr:methyltransferase [Sphingomonas abietis]WBO21459.1 methyltransferase [Sphingomonas abietis]